MRIKLDENFDVRLIPLITQRGHDVDTVMAEKLTGQPDEAIYEACLRNKRVLFTLDMHFSNPLRFSPDETEGIVVLRLPRPILPLMKAALLAALPKLAKDSLRGGLWIVEAGRIRVYDPRDERL